MSIQPGQDGAAASPSQTVWWILAATAAGMGALLALFPAAGHDQLWFLLMARRWVHGAVLYGPEAFDSNPPGIVWASAMPVVLGQWLHVSATLPAKAFVLLVETICGWLTYFFLRRNDAVAIARRPIALLFGFIVLAVVLPARDFGQRDQLLSILILPYVVGAVCPAADFRRARMIGGILAAVGLCLKPQYAVIPVAVEGYLLLRPRAGSASHRLRGLMRPEPVLLLVSGGLYLAAIARFTPLYFSLALPLLRQTYWAVGHLSIAGLMWQAIELCVLAVVTTGLFFGSRRRTEVVRVLLIAGAGAGVAYFFQGTGWYYQQIPGLVLFGAALGLQLLDLLGAWQPAQQRWVTPAVAGLGALALGLTTHFMGYPFTRDRAFAIDTPDPAFFTGAPVRSVAMLTTSVDETMMPVERYGLLWGQRTNNLWMLPAVLRSEQPLPGATSGRKLSAGQVAALDALQKQWMVEDLQRWQPDVVLVKRCADPAVQCQLLEDRHDDLLAWFLRDAAFAHEWQQYRPGRPLGPYDAYYRDQAF